KPDYYFGHSISVLEKGLDTELPITVTNLESVNFNYNVLTPKETKNQQQGNISIPEAVDVAFKTPLQVRNLIPGESGVVTGNITSTPSISKYPTWFFTQVTPFHVQVKVGHYDTLVWMTDFATGQPVAGADVSIYPTSYGAFEQSSDALAKAVTDENGIAMLPGSMMLDPDLTYLNNYSDSEPRLFVRATKDDDIALLALDYNFSLNMYQLSEGEVYGYSRKRYGHIKTWGTTAQGVYKVGDTIQYKLMVRDQSNTSLITPPKKGYHLKVTDPTGKMVHEVKDLTLSEFGGHAGEFTLPKTAAVGWYDFELNANFTENSYWRPMRVLVSDFTPSPFRVTTQLNGELFKLGDIVVVDTAANLHAGGPYADAHTRVYASLRQSYFSSKHPQAKGFQFDTWQDGGYDTQVVNETTGSVDSKGQLKTEFKLADTQILYGNLFIESAVRDDRGKDVASSTSAKFVGRDRFVGLKQTSWVLKEDELSSILTQVVNEHGKPMPGSAVTVLIERRETKASRVKGAGNAYLTKYEHKWVKAAECSLTSTEKPQACDFTPENPGLYRMTASIKDTQNRAHSSQLSQWVSGKGQVVWEIPTGYGLPISPEQETYKAGDKARYLINNPYPGAKALITVERYGILKSWVQTFENSVEVLEFEVEPDFIPGFYLSVMVMSPRVDKPLGEGKVDLGKPAFRMGYVKTEVRDPYKELLVDINTDKQEYRPRDKVTVQLQAKARQADADVGPIELAVAVLDESVFDLLSQGRAYFDPYQGFYGLEDLDMRNYNLLQHLIGRQKFEKKGANPGGDGGGGSDLSLRSLFKFVSYWNPSIQTDKDGKATIDFELPDNLTGWRVLAMAVNPGDRMGLGDSNFKVNQPVEVRPVLPNQITSGDSFEAGFSVMNRTEQMRSLKVKINARHRNSDKEESVEQTVEAEPYKRYTVWLPLEKMPAGEIELIAHAADSEEQDGMTKSLIVRKRRSLHTGATYGSTTDTEVTESIAFPSDIYTDVGGLNLVMSPSIINGVEGAFEYMRDYPYACWEQKLSKGTMASHFQNLRPWLAEELSWEGSKELPAQTLLMAPEHQAPNGGMAYYIPTNNRVSPYLSAYTALAFNWLRDSDHQVPGEVETRLHGYLDTMLKKDVMPTFFSPGMAATVRAVALAALAKQGKVTLADLNRYQPHAKDMSLFGKSQFLSAAIQVAGTQAMQKETVDMILAHANQSGGKFTFSETLDDSYSRILASSLRDNCSILSSLVAYAEKGGKDYVRDVPFKLVRSIIATRKSRTHWPNTQENMFCMNALIDYSRVYEKDKPAMQVRAWLGDDSLGDTRFNDLRDPAVTMKHEMQPTDEGRKTKLKITKEGQGRLYYGVHVQYAPKEDKAEAVNSGIEVRREYHVERDGKWELLSSPMKLKTGELVRVDLYLSLPSPRNFVVVDDPVPGGLEPVNRDLATASQVDADKANGQYSGGSFWFKHGDWNEYGVSFWSFYHKELRHHAAIFYSDYLSAGNYHLSYVAQAIAPGNFAVMPTHSEEMYEPDVYGKGKPARLQVIREK
ncbi:MAG: alpha-2-macroglobulin family protein, partial [Pseudomonadota bacterium]